MYRYILSAVMLLLSLNVSAQVTSPLLNCTPSEGYGFPFTAKFNGQNATVVFKGWTYNLRYTGAYVNPTGERVSEYKNQEIYVLTTFPFDKYVSIHTGGSSPNVIAGAFCH
jgi:hypothetical protein